jgi:hypothetical protein
VTLPYFIASSAKVSPAIPEPITRKSVLFFIITKCKTGGKDTNRFSLLLSNRVSLTLPLPFPQAGSFAKIAYQAIFSRSALLNNKGRVNDLFYN